MKKPEIIFFGLELSLSFLHTEKVQDKEYKKKKETPNKTFLS